MSSSPEIPDAISPEALASLLGDYGSMPISTLLPALDFGRECGGPADLQFAVLQLMQGATQRPNLVQMLVAALHLITESHISMSRRERSIDEDEDFADLAKDEQHIIRTVIKENNKVLRHVMGCLESFMVSQIGLNYYHERARSIAHSSPEFKRSLEDFRSYLLISDELLESLQLERPAVTRFLDQCVNNDDET